MHRVVCDVCETAWTPKEEASSWVRFASTEELRRTAPFPVEAFPAPDHRDTLRQLWGMPMPVHVAIDACPGCVRTRPADVVAALRAAAAATLRKLEDPAIFERNFGLSGDLGPFGAGASASAFAALREADVFRPTLPRVRPKF